MTPRSMLLVTSRVAIGGFRSLLRVFPPILLPFLFVCLAYTGSDVLMGDLRKSLEWCLGDELEEVLMKATKERRPEGQKTCVTYIS